MFMRNVTQRNFDTDSIVSALISENLRLKRQLDASDQVEQMNTELVDMLMARIEHLEIRLRAFESIQELGDKRGRSRQSICKSKIRCSD